MSLSIQKANFWKRISAFLFDFIITAILVIGVATVLSFAFGFDKQTAKAGSYIEEHKARIEAEYDGVDFDISEDAYNNLSAEQKDIYAQAQKDLEKATNEDERLVKAYQTAFCLILVIISISVFTGILTVEFIIPLFFHNGQTLGKKIFGIALVRSNCVKVSNFVLFARTVIGKYAIETMFPLVLLILMVFNLMGIVGIITIGLLVLLEIGVLIVTKYNASIHDLLSDTIAVDMASQRIFDTQDEMLAFVKKEQAEEAAKQEY